MDIGGVGWGGGAAATPLKAILFRFFGPSFLNLLEQLQVLEDTVALL